MRKILMLGWMVMIGMGFVTSPYPALAEVEGNNTENRLSFHGYGELHYNNPRGSTVPVGSQEAQMDFHRMVWGLSYQYNDRISLHTEVDFEHAAREMELEYAYLDFLINQAVNVRAGAVLMPVGPLNEFHEPPLFYSVERPYVQRTIIPTTWGEGGAGVFGSALPGLKYRIYVVSGLNANGFTSVDGIRDGRGKVAGGSGNVTPAAPRTGEKLAYVGRFEYVGLPGLALGTSLYRGGTNQQKEGALHGTAVAIIEGDIRYQVAGLDLRGVFTQINVKGADKISIKRGQTIGEEMVGWYLEGAYDLLRLVAPDLDQSTVIFIRYEDFDTHHKVPSGFTKALA
ncbi:MAG: hypothetical protein L0Y56_07460, partial [Nitrospira sp.]|nr:hypothetical protein [Nitrospira sp.]